MYLRILSVLGLVTLLSLQSVSARTWVNSTGQPIKGGFLELRNGSVRIRLDADGKVVSVPLKVLSKADQEFVRKRAMTGKADLVALAVKRIDAAVDAGLEKQKLNYNENLNDHMYLRRIYLDLAGRIPNYDEAKEFLDSRNRNKRQELVIKLLKSWDYASHNYNHLAELLRHPHVALVGHDRLAGVHHLVELGLDRLDHLGVAVTDVEHADTAGEIDEALAILVPELGVLRPRGELDRRAGRTAGHVALLEFVEFCIGHGCISHGTLLLTRHRVPLT